jgi:pilus assembly protein Flp/PilA
MRKFSTMVKNFLADEQGATAIEYGLIAALIAVVIITGENAVGTNLSAIFLKLADCLKSPKGALCV